MTQPAPFDTTVPSPVDQAIPTSQDPTANFPANNPQGPSSPATPSSASSWSPYVWWVVGGLAVVVGLLAASRLR